jgi:hypothetical protein
MELCYILYLGSIAVLKERTEMLEITEFEAGSGVCPFTEFPADYRVLDGARFCVVCGDDHEAE